MIQFITYGQWLLILHVGDTNFSGGWDNYGRMA